jgi:hypothetical protein
MAQAKFKLGDRVLIKENPSAPKSVGKIGVITRVETRCIETLYKVTLVGCKTPLRYWATDEFLECKEESVKKI